MVIAVDPNVIDPAPDPSSLVLALEEDHCDHHETPLIKLQCNVKWQKQTRQQQQWSRQDDG